MRRIHRLVILLVSLLLRRKQRHHEVRQQQRAQDDARCQEDQVVALRERLARGKSERDGHDDGQRDGALRARKRGDQGIAYQLTACTRLGAAMHALHDKHPQEAHAHYQGRYEQHQGAQQKRAGLAAVPRRHDGLRQLHTQHDEDHAVDDEDERLPHAIRRKLQTRGRRRWLMRHQRDEQAGSHHSQDTACAEMLGRQERDERREHLEHHMHRDALVAVATDGAERQHRQQAHHQADRDAAKEADGKALRGIGKGKRTRDGRSYGELERNDARCVVDERLAGEQGFLTAGQVDILAKGRDGHGIGGPQRRTQGERRRKRDGGLEPVQHETDHQNRGEHQADCKGHDGPLVVPQPTFACMPRFVEQQWSDEQHKEQLRIDCHVDGRAHQQDDDGA